MQSVYINPLISIIVNCYNGEEFLIESLNSVLLQTYQNWELIFWDNQSVDKSAEIFQSYDDLRFKYFLAPKHTSLGIARNEAINFAKGEWIAILDCDDLWDSRKLELQVIKLNNFNSGLIYTNFNLIDKSGKKSLESGYFKFYEGDLFQQIFKEEITICWPSVLFKKSIFNELCGFNNYKYLEDFDFLIRLAYNNKIYFVNRKLVDYRIHNQQLSVNFSEMLNEKLLIINKWTDKLVYEDSKNKELIQKAKSNAYFIAAFNAIKYKINPTKYLFFSLKYRFHFKSIILLILYAIFKNNSLSIILFFEKKMKNLSNFIK